MGEICGAAPARWAALFVANGEFKLHLTPFIRTPPSYCYCRSHNL